VSGSDPACAPGRDLSVVLLSYNTRDFTEGALRTVLEASAGLSVEVLVVDNASRDGSADMIAAKFPQVDLIRNPRNVGFSAGNNVALRRVRGRHVLLLNTDTIVRRDTLRRMVEFMDAHPEAGAVGCKILNDRSNGLAGSTPRCPEIYQGRLFRLHQSIKFCIIDMQDFVTCHFCLL